MLTRHRGTTAKVARDEDMHLPLHAPAVDTVNIKKIKDTGMIAEALSWIEGLDKKTNLKKRQKTEARSDDIEKLEAAGVIERCTKEQIRVTGSLFSVVEAEKGRRRPIYWPKALNRALEDKIPQVELSDSIEHAQVEKNIWAATFDLKASFFQIELPPRTRELFGLMTNCGTHRFKRLPMGFSASPFIMNEVTKLCAATGVENVRTDVYIDNVRFTSKSKELVEKASQIFRERCAEFGATLNVEEGNAPHQSGEFLGLHFDYVNGTVKLGKKTMTKLRNARVMEKATKREYLAMFGLTLFCTRALRIQPARYFNQMKFIRKRCVGEELDEEINIWPSCVDGWVSWLNELRKNTPTRHEPGDADHPDATIFTDASTVGWGAVLVKGSSVHTVAGRWKKPIDCSEISTYEALAVSIAADAFANLIRNCKTILLRTDNSPTLFTLKKGCAKEFELNDAIRKCAESFAKAAPHAAIFVMHVATKENPADPLSRGQERLPPSALRSLGVVESGELRRVFTHCG